MKAYQFLLILNPTDEERKSGKEPAIIKDVTTILAPDCQAAAMLAGRAIPNEHLDKISRIEVALRPF